MKTKELLIALLLFLVAATFSDFMSTSDMNSLLDKLINYNISNPQEKLYLHLDKPVYVAGEDLWYNAYLLNASSHQPDSISKIIYVELFNSSKRLVLQQMLPVSSGTSRGDIHLDDSLPQGTYLLRAYTTFMKNQGQDFFFSKRIPIVSLAKVPRKQPTRAAIPPDIQFFPEGGNIIEGVENRIAFKAINENGTGIDIDGEIRNSAGKVVASFETEYAGMGKFSFTPQKNENYFATVKSLAGSFPLPKSQEGYLLRVMDVGSNLKVIIYRNSGKQPVPVILIGQTRGMVAYSARAELKNQSLVLNIPKSSFESGIAQITLFDSNGIPQCERLTFINHQDALKLSVQASKTSYQAKERVDMDIEATKINGTPVDGSFSFTVYDEGKIQDPETFPSTIVENLLLTSDLTGRIDEPGYYLKDTLPETKNHLDLLMMTHGWRRFTWKEVLADEKPVRKFLPEQGITISGRVLNFPGKKGQKGSVNILTSLGGITNEKVDSLGNFKMDPLLYYDSIKLTIQTNKNGTQSQYPVQLISPKGPDLIYAPIPYSYFNTAELIDQVMNRNKVTRGFGSSGNSIMLKEVPVKSTGTVKNNSLSPYGINGSLGSFLSFRNAYNGSDFNNGLSFNPAMAQFSGALNGQNIQSNNMGYSLFLMQRLLVDADMIRTLPLYTTVQLDVVKNTSNFNNYVVYGRRGTNGIFNIYLVDARAVNDDWEVKGLPSEKFPGLYLAREFYSPQYDKPVDENLYDIRNTLYWNPSVKTDSLGKAHISFYTSDIKSNYRIQIEGISASGIPGSGISSMVVH